MARSATPASNAILKITKRTFGIKRALLLYRLLQLVSFPFVITYFVARLLTDRAYWSHFGERLGFLPRSFHRTDHGAIWLHAVSVGEIASAIPLINKLRADQPLTPIYISVSTIAGRKAAKRRIASTANGIFYCPLDYVSCVRRTLKTIKPSLVIILETEIWPHIYNETKRSGALLGLVNARISSRTWPRYHAASRFFAPILRLADVILAQSELDRIRYELLGADPTKLFIVGNLKYDVPVPATHIDIPTFDAEQVWIAASTVGPNERGSSRRHSIDEDNIVIRTFSVLAAKFPRLLLILAPRQPTRFDEVARKLENAKVNYLRRSALKRGAAAALELPGVLLLDSIGELAGLYSRAQAVLVGGSIAPRGGHNIIEPAAASAAIVVGPHMENFEAIARDFLDAKAIIQIQKPKELLPAIRDFLSDIERAGDFGRRARYVVERQQGACSRTADHLWHLYHQMSPSAAHGLFMRPLLKSCSLLWEQGGRVKRQRAEQRADISSTLPAPVISVGGITVGGSGKTPFVDYLAACLHRRGYLPAILTRGYRRRSPAENLIFSPGMQVPLALTGDEAQIFLRTDHAAVGIGADRYKTARLLLEQFPETDVLLLDDGFQHARMARDFDVVVIDGLDPFGREALVPLGRLREPLSSLSRAGAFVVTRAEDDRRYRAISERLRRHNANAPIFRTRLVVKGWRMYAQEDRLAQLPAKRIAAFCGLGNPQNFWNTLESLGLEIVFQWAFGDHHVYKPVELQRIAHQARIHGAEMLVTTEKDRINCPDHLKKALTPFDLAWLEIELKLEDESRFFTVLERVLSRRGYAA